MDSVYVLRVRGCNKAGYGEYSEEVYLHTPPAPGDSTRKATLKLSALTLFLDTLLYDLMENRHNLSQNNDIYMPYTNICKREAKLEIKKNLFLP